MRAIGGRLGLLLAALALLAPFPGGCRHRVWIDRFPTVATDGSGTVGLEPVLLVWKARPVPEADAAAAIDARRFEGQALALGLDAASQQAAWPAVGPIRAEARPAPSAGGPSLRLAVAFALDGRPYALAGVLPERHRDEKVVLGLHAVPRELARASLADLDRAMRTGVAPRVAMVEGSFAPAGWTRAVLDRADTPPVLGARALEAIAARAVGVDVALAAAISRQAERWLALPAEHAGRAAAIEPALDLLGAHGHEAATDRLLERALGDRDPAVRNAAALLLAERRRAPEAFEPLLDVARDARWPRRARALRALSGYERGEATTAIVRALADPDGDVRQAAAAALAARPVGARDLPALKETHGAAPWDGRVVVVRTVARVPGPEAGAFLAGALGDPDGDVRAASAAALAARPPEGHSVEALAAAARNAPWEGRVVVVRLLGPLPGPLALRTLARGLVDPDGDVRKAAAAALAARALAPEDVPALAEVAGSSPWESRLFAVLLLSRIEGTEATNAIVRRLSDSDADVRKAAATALERRLAGAGSVPALAEAAARAPGDGSAAAARALARVEDPAIVAALARAAAEAPWEGRVAAVERLAPMAGPVALEAIVRALGDGDADVRRAAAEALKGRDLAPADVPALASAFERAGWEGRLSAVRAVARVPGPEATAALASRLVDADADVRRAALAALRDRPLGPEDVRPLVAPLRSGGWEARAARGRAARADGEPRGGGSAPRGAPRRGRRGREGGDRPGARRPRPGARAGDPVSSSSSGGAASQTPGSGAGGKDSAFGVPRAPLLAKALALLAIVLGAAGLRLWAAGRPHVIQRDAILYAALARALVEDEARRALDHDYPPGYPALVAAAVTLLGTEDIPRSTADDLADFDPPRGPRLRDVDTDAPYLFAGSLVSAVLGALTVVPAFLLGRRAAARAETRKAAPAPDGPTEEAAAPPGAEPKPGAEPRILGRASARIIRSAAAAALSEAEARAEATAAAEGRLAADKAGLIAAALLALHPLHIVYSAHALTEASFGFFLLLAAAAALAAAARVRPLPALFLAVVAGAATGAAYAVRPEGLVVLPVAALLGAAARGPIGARAARVGGLLVAFAAVAAPVLIDMNRPPAAAPPPVAAADPATASPEAPAPAAAPDPTAPAPPPAAAAPVETPLRVSKKKDPAALLRAARAAPGEVLSRALGNAARTVEVGHPLLLALALAGAVLALLRRGPARAAGVGILLLAAAFLLVYSLVRVDRRFALELSIVLLPLAAPAVGAVAAALGRRIGGADRGALATIALAAVATVPVLLHKARNDKPHLVACARAIRDAADRAGIGRPVVLAEDVRIPYYARGIPISEVDIEAELRAGRGDFVVIDGGAGPARARAVRDAAEAGLREPLPEGLPRTARVVSVLEPLGEFKPPPGEGGDIYLLYGFRRATEILPGK